MDTLATGIIYIDLDFLGSKRIIATAIIQGAGRVALIDPGPTTCLETLRTALDVHGISIGDIASVFLTHIHLDHAGVTGSLLRENPAIEVFVHERGAAHMVDPTKLLASAGRLYGDDMERLWGDVLPVPEARVRRLSGGERVDAGDREFEVAYLPGHASHHVGYFDRSSGIAFVGDTAGVRTGDSLFAMAPTPPPDIDVGAWKESIALIRAWRPSTLFITHFGPHEDVDPHLDSLLQHLDAMTETACQSLEGERADDDRKHAFVDEMRVYLQRHLPASEVALYDNAAPLTMCWLGLARYLRKRGTT